MFEKNLTFKCMQVLDGPEEGQLQPTHVQYVLSLYSLPDAKCISLPVHFCVSFYVYTFMYSIDN